MFLVYLINFRKCNGLYLILKKLNVLVPAWNLSLKRHSLQNICWFISQPDRSLSFWTYYFRWGEGRAEFLLLYRANLCTNLSKIMENYWPLFYWSFISFVFVCKIFYKLFENTLLYLMPCISYHGSINLNPNISHDAVTRGTLSERAKFLHWDAKPGCVLIPLHFN